MTFDLKKIIVATDFGPASDHAFTYARALAERFDAALHLLHVVETPLPPSVWSEAYALDLPALRTQLVDEAGEHLAEIAAKYASLPLTTEVRCGRAAQAIVECARERKADLLVLGTHGHGLVAQLLLGSVAERVVRGAPCAVLTVRQPAAAVPLEAQQVAVPAMTGA